MDNHFYNSPFLLENNTNYLAWRRQKLANYPLKAQDLIVIINDPFHLTSQEHEELIQLCCKTNLVIYQIANNLSVDKTALHALAKQLGLHRLDHNLCAQEDGVAALQVVTQGRSQEYIPYTNRPLNWHTDGYYNPPTESVQAILMQCIRPALQGGENSFLDHEIAYLLLRDKNPEYIAALMAPTVMTIPANIEQGVELRPAQTSPVFSISPSGALCMRYTARTRNIIWQESEIVKKALAYLTQCLQENSSYVFHHRLAANQGVLCNNVLHNRSGFTDSDEPQQKRLLYRMRFYDRVNC